MRRGLLLSTAVAVLALVGTAAATAVRAPVEDGTLSVRDGRATIQLRMKGGLIGRFTRGKITVTHHGADSLVIRGAERVRVRNARTTVYSGKNIRFRITDDRKFVATIDASKINLSAVGRGETFRDGRGDPANGIYFDGSYSRNGEDYRSIPDLRERWELAAPASGDPGR